jgi:hypothetical protein
MQIRLKTNPSPEGDIPHLRPGTGGVRFLFLKRCGVCNKDSGLLVPNRGSD